MFLISTLLIFTNEIHAKVICTEDCQGHLPSKSRQEESESINEEKSLNKVSNESKIVGKKTIVNNIKRGISSEEVSNSSNLPPYFNKLAANSIESSFVVIPKTEARKKLDGLSSGSILKIVIQQDIVASNQVPTPIVGTVVSGLYKDSKVYGEAILDNELKRVLFNFKTISGGRLIQEYSLKASGLDVLGRVGMTGKYHADDISFGIASFFATATAIAADSQVERSKNNNGDYVENPSAENATKKGVAGALGKVAERLSNRAMTAPGRTEVEGPLLLQLILEEPPYFKR